MNKNRARQILNLVLDVWKDRMVIQSYSIIGEGKSHEIRLVLPMDTSNLLPIQKIVDRHDLAMRQEAGYLVLYPPGKK